MIFSWTEDLATGVAEIDGQHKELFSRVNGLLEACNQKKGKEEIGRFLGFLEDYVIQHFTAEEKKMTELSYPGLSGHKAEHLEFTKKIVTIKKEFLEFGAEIHVVLMSVRASGDWLVSHIKKTDKAMAEFLRSKGAR